MFNLRSNSQLWILPHWTFESSQFPLAPCEFCCKTCSCRRYMSVIDIARAQFVLAHDSVNQTTTSTTSNSGEPVDDELSLPVLTRNVSARSLSLAARSFEAALMGD